MSTMTLYHGSPEIIQQPVFGKGKSYNDYGLGFYCTEHLDLAKEWACTENTDGYANRYEINTEGLNILNLSDEQYTILHWLALLMELFCLFNMVRGIVLSLQGKAKGIPLFGQITIIAYRLPGQ